MKGTNVGRTDLTPISGVIFAKVSEARLDGSFLLILYSSKSSFHSLRSIEGSASESILKTPGRDCYKKISDFLSTTALVVA